MPLFNFELIPAQQLKPWGAGGEYTWFALTDGFLHIDVADIQLFRFSNDTLRVWADESSGEKRLPPYLNYQVARFYEDLFNVLPHILNPIPAELHRHIEKPEAYAQWRERLLSAFNHEDESTFFTASNWFETNRFICSNHLTSNPRLWMWRLDNNIHIRWDFSQKLDGGIPVWTAGRGETILNYSDFLDEVTDFHTRLMQAMQQQIEQLPASHPTPLLWKEHETRKNDALHAFRPTQTIDWQEILTANRTLLAQTT